jgi:hypothetical protein
VSAYGTPTFTKDGIALSSDSQYLFYDMSALDHFGQVVDTIVMWVKSSESNANGDAIVGINEPFNSMAGGGWYMKYAGFTGGPVVYSNVDGCGFDNSSNIDTESPK